MVRAAWVRYGSGACKAESRVPSAWKTVLFEKNRTLSGRISGIFDMNNPAGMRVDFVPK